MQRTDPILIHGLSKRFGRKQVLSSVTLSVPRGVTTALLGRNGAGKTTILRILAGLLPRNRGVVSVAGIDPKKHAKRVKAVTGYVPDVPVFHPRWRVRDAVGLVRSARRKRWDADEAKRLMDAFELIPADRIGDLSKGARAKLSLLLALAHRPEVVLLDEPASGLDPVSRKEVLGSLVDIMEREGTAILISTHRLDDVERLAERVAFLKDGQIVVEGVTEELRAGRGVPEAYLNHPGLSELYSALLDSEHKKVPSCVA
jgi:ABC-2 type transport system ATP-binding protein